MAILGSGPRTTGAAMIPYTMIKEANPDNVKGSATGVMNFIVFMFSACLAPIVGLVLTWLSGGKTLTLTIFHEADTIWVGAVVLSFILALFLRETGHRARPAVPIVLKAKALT